MDIFERIKKKTGRTIIGLMSGTSMDGIDVCIVKIINKDDKTDIIPIDYLNFPYPKGLSERFKLLIAQEQIKLNDISQLNVLTGSLFADAALKIIKKNNITPHSVDLIGSHGQTIWHSPDIENLFGKHINSSLQIGCISTIAKKTGITVTGNFRMGDIAEGGQGAPLIPYFDYFMFNSADENIVALNIGGISNITVIPAGCSLNEITAFDCGPGNLLTDYFCNLLFNKDYDINGTIAEKGKISQDLFEKISDVEFFDLKPPKSTGREYFGKEFFDKINSLSAGMKISDTVLFTTISELTPYSIYKNIKNHLDFNVNKLIISGGGAKNNYFINRLTKYLPDTVICSTEDYGINPDAKESIAFAFFANELINGKCINIKKATGAKKSTLCGEIAFP